MTTLLFLHAHPDDESILTGATIAKAKARGARVVVAFASQGDAGETNADLGGESIGDRREREARAACAALGVDRVVFLGYRDSGMDGTDTTAHPEAFVNADLDEVAARLAMSMVAEDIHAIVGYDRNGHYGHPDHKMIHRAAHHAAEALHASFVIDVTYDREVFRGENSPYENVDDNFASSTDEITHIVRGAEWADKKLEALMHHQSQVPDDFDPDDQSELDNFREAFSQEWHIITPTHDAAELGALTAIFEDFVPST